MTERPLDTRQVLLEAKRCQTRVLATVALLERLAAELQAEAEVIKQREDEESGA